MAYLLDSNIVILYLADDPETIPLVERLIPDSIAISMITYMETYQGTLRSPDPTLAQEKFEHFLEMVPVIPLSLPVARHCAQLRESLRHQGKQVRARAFDLVIAATALEYNFKLVTRNLDDFTDIPNLLLYQPS